MIKHADKVHRMGSNKDREKDERRMRMFESGMTLEEMAVIENVTGEAIRSWCHRNGLIEKRVFKYPKKPDRSDPTCRGFLRMLLNIKINYPGQTVDVLAVASAYREVMG